MSIFAVFAQTGRIRRERAGRMVDGWRWIGEGSEIDTSKANARVLCFCSSDWVFIGCDLDDRSIISSGDLASCDSVLEGSDGLLRRRLWLLDVHFQRVNQSLTLHECKPVNARYERKDFDYR